MPDHSKTRLLDRRRFLKRTMTAAGWIGMAAATQGWAKAQAKAKPEGNPFAYDVSRLAKTDPRLLQYAEINRFRSPHGEARRLAIGADDQLYVAAGRYVSALLHDGTVLNEIALTEPARCLAPGATGDLYVGLRNRIEVFDRQGRRRSSWEAAAPRTWFTGLALSQETLYAADAGNRVVLRYDLAGKLLGRIGEKSKILNVPGFIVPSPYFDLVMHRDGLLRVTNPGRHRVEVYTPQGDFEAAWGKPSSAIDGFCGCCNPISLGLLKDGRIITCEKGLLRVKIHQVDGALESVVAGPESFAAKTGAVPEESLSDGPQAGLDVAVDSADRIYILDRSAAEIRVMARKSKASAARGAQPTTGT